MNNPIVGAYWHPYGYGKKAWRAFIMLPASEGQYLHDEYRSHRYLMSESLGGLWGVLTNGLKYRVRYTDEYFESKEEALEYAKQEFEKVFPSAQYE